MISVTPGRPWNAFDRLVICIGKLPTKPSFLQNYRRLTLSNAFFEFKWIARLVYGQFLRNLLSRRFELVKTIFSCTVRPKKVYRRRLAGNNAGRRPAVH